MKGLIYYHDRVKELREDPTLALFSPTPSRSSTMTALTTPVEITPCKLDLAEAKEEDDELQPSQPSRRKRGRGT